MTEIIHADIQNPTENKEATHLVDRTIRKDISFHFHPFNYEKSEHYIEKSDTTGQKRKYICGISSGINTDLHGERMTEKCIKSFMSQANSGQVLLYPDIHGIKASEDIGILTKAEIVDNGNWYTEYRLYDENDGIGQFKLEKINDIWKQLKGEPPYRKPLQKGFSIEGYIPESGIVSAEKDVNGNIGKRVIDEVLLDGVIICPRPAYNDSIANAVYKALGEWHPAKKEIFTKKIQSKLKEQIENLEQTKQYNQKKWDLNNILEESILEIMNKEDDNKQEALDILFREYSELMIDLILKSNSYFAGEIMNDELINTNSPYSVHIGKSSNFEVNKELMIELEKIQKILKNRYSEEK